MRDRITNNVSARIIPVPLPERPPDKSVKYIDVRKIHLLYLDFCSLSSWCLARFKAARKWRTRNIQLCRLDRRRVTARTSIRGRATGSRADRAEVRKLGPPDVRPGFAEAEATPDRAMAPGRNGDHDRGPARLALAGRRRRREGAHVLVQSRRNTRAAVRLMRKLIRKQGFAPATITTDGLGSYGAARRQLGLTALHERRQRHNNRAENLHQPTRRRERKMQRFESPGSAGGRRNAG